MRQIRRWAFRLSEATCTLAEKSGKHNQDIIAIGAAEHPHVQ
jgi:hypothetical protein